MSFFTYSRLTGNAVFQIRNVIANIQAAYPKLTRSDRQSDILSVLIQAEHCLNGVIKQMAAEKELEATQHKCAACGKIFPSDTRLWAHVKKCEVKML